jgi:hypothetical protein
MFVVLLTNRVHAARARRPAKVIADVRADLADAAALAVTDSDQGILSMPASFRADRAVGWNRPEHAARSRSARSRRSKSSSRASARASRSSKSKASARSSSSSKSKARASAKKSTSSKKKAVATKKPTSSKKRTAARH